MTTNISGAAVPLKFKDKNGKIIELQFSPLSDIDSDELDLWLQSRLIENARNAARNCTPEQYTIDMRIANEQALELTFMSSRGVKMLATLAGMTRLCWQSVKKRHPEITQEQLRELLLSPENMDELNTAFVAAHRIPEGKHSKNRQRAVRRK